MIMDGSCTSFNGESKKQWFWADVDGLFGILSPATAFEILLIGFVGIVAQMFSSSDIMVPVSKFVSTRLNLWWFGGIWVVAHVGVAMYIVFVRRCNPSVIGPPRQFRYIYRWL